MDANQWSWGKSLLRVVAGVARNDPMVTQYESVLRAELTEALCGMGLTVVRSRAEYIRSIQYYCISHRQGALEFVRNISVIGFDISKERIDLMKQGIDPSKELVNKRRAKS